MAAAEAPDYAFFDLTCTHAELGFELGAHDPLFVAQPWWAAPPSSRFAESCAAVVRDLHPALLDESDAYAEAQRQDSRELWRWCCRVNLKARVRATSNVTAEAGEGCSTFALRVRRGGADFMLVGRNYDYWPTQARRQRIRFTPAPASAPSRAVLPSVGARGSVPGGRYDGMNQAGLFVSLHVVMTDSPRDDELRPGLPFHLAGRIALERCHTAREAADLLSRAPHLSSLNFLVADARDAFVIEADPRRVRALGMDGDALAATNHFRHPDMAALQGRRATANSACRLNFLLEQHFAPDDGANTNARVDDLLDHAQKVMADRTAPMCGEGGALTTLWSCVAELSSRRIRYAAGPPTRAPFVEIKRP